MGAMTEGFQAWVAFLDVYGFKALFTQQKKTPSEVAGLLYELQARAEAEAKCDVSFTYFFSDAIVLIQRATDTPDRGLQRIEELIRHLCLEATRHGLALRGAVTFGEMVADQSVCVGMPLAKAYELEQRMAMPIVILPQRYALDGNHSLLKDLRDIPMKDGMLRAFAILPSPITPLRELASRFEQAALVNGPHHVASVWQRTREFCDAVILDRNDDD